MKKLKIVFFTDTFLPQINGVVSAVINSTNGLSALGHEVLIVAPKAKLLKEKHIKKYPDLNTEILQLPSMPAILYPGFRISFPYLPRTIKKIQKFQPDIIHFHTPLTLGMEAILIAKTLEKPLIGTFHTFFMEKEYLRTIKLHKLHAERIITKLGWEYSNLFYNKADMIITPSKYTTNILKENGCSKPIITIPNPIEFVDYNYTSLSLHEREKIKKRFKIPKENCVILWLGRLSPEKNLQIALKAFNLLLERTQKVTFLMIGDGPEKKYLEKIAKKNIENKKIIFTGAIPHDQLIKQHILAIGDIFFSASTSENQPISALEAMSEGLPLVITNQRGTPELIDGNGYICKEEDIQEMAEMLYALLINNGQRRVMGEKSREISRRYDNRIIAGELENVYNQLLTKRRESAVIY